MVFTAMSDVRRVCAVALAAAVAVSALVACTPTVESAADESEPTAIEATVVDGKIQPTVTVPEALPTPVAAEVTQLTQVSDVIFGTPVEIKLDGELPASGAELTKTYAAPLPDDAAVTFAYWDEEYEVWSAVPTTLSSDRRTASAVVHHFSLWNDFVAGSQAALGSVRDAAIGAGQAVSQWAGDVAEGTGQFISGAADAVYWSAANILATRVELPECDQSTPDWVLELATRVAVNDPVRFCAGHDAANPDLLVVKARSNRGYGFPVSLATEAAWEYNSTSEQSLGSMIETVGAVDAAIGESMAMLLNNGRFVGAGDEISFGLAPSAFRDYNSEFLVELPAPSVPQFVFSTMSAWAAAWGISKLEGGLAAAIVVAHCFSRLSSQTDIGTAAGTVLSCSTEGSDQIISVMDRALTAKGYPGTGAGKVVKRLGMAAALISGGIVAAEYVIESTFPQSARALAVSVNPDTLGAGDPATWTITEKGIGPAEIGATTVADAVSSFFTQVDWCGGLEFYEATGSSPVDFGIITHPGPNGVGGIGVRVPGDIALTGPIAGSPATESGIRLGSTLDQLRAAEPSGSLETEAGWSQYIVAVGSRWIIFEVSEEEPFVRGITVTAELPPAGYCG